MNENQRKEGFSPLTLFYSYADEDEDLSQELEKHLSLLSRQGFIATWHHRKILPGDHREQSIDDHLSSANIILLLISPDFLASDSSYDEMQQAVQRHKDGTAHVIPLLLRPVDWESAPFAHLHYLPRNGKPVTTWKNRDLAFIDITKGVRSVIELKYHLAAANAPTLSSFPSRSAFPFVSLAYAPADLSLAEQLKTVLQTHNITGWIDYQSMQPGNSDDGEALREAIRNASAVVLIATPHTRRSRLCEEELHIAKMYQRPVYVFWLQGNQPTEVLPVTWSLSPIDARGTCYPQALQELLSRLAQAPSSPHTSQMQSSVPTLYKDPRNPYKGLRAFRGEDARDFFGRDRLIHELLQAIQQCLTPQQQNSLAVRLLTILGPSGSGKSSVVMAGLIPHLKQGALAGSQHWHYLDTLVPGPHPLEALALTLAPLFPERSLKSLREDLEEDSARGLHLLLATRSTPAENKAVLVIDQFEELFTQTTTEYERQHFLNLLLTAVSEPQGPLLVILTLRADFYDRPLRYSELGRLIQANHIVVWPMSIDDFRAVIERPASLPDVHVTFEEDLVGDLLFEVQGQTGVLPLLQFTLDQLFQKRDNHMLTRKAYREIGGIAGALVRHAEATYNTVPASAQPLVRELLLRLINPGTIEQEATKRRVPLASLTFTTPSKAAYLQQVITTFINARLLTTTSIAKTPVLEIGHEALIQQWTRLANWLHAAREDILL